MMRLPIIVFLLVLFFCSTKVMAFANVSYNWPKPGGYNLDHVITIKDIPNPKFGGFFWSHQFYVGDKQSQNVMYMGLQQQISGSKNVIFSIFYDKGTNVNPDNVVCIAKTSSCEASGKAGDQTPGAQIIAPYEWQADHSYRLRVWSAPPQGKDESGWWAFYVKDMTNNEETLIGYIYNQNRPNGGLNPTQYSVGWGEVYGGQQMNGDCAYSFQKVVWEQPTMDNGSNTASFGVPNPSSEKLPFKIFVSEDQSQYEMLTCPIGGIPYGAFGKTACYFLGANGSSCEEVCTKTLNLPTPQCSQSIQYTRGNVGASEAILPYLGTPDQGGNSARCNSIASILGFPNVEAGTRLNEGVGCHVMNKKSWYLLDPNTENNASAPGVERICGCGS